MLSKKPKELPYEQVLEKMTSYCAYQERCISEVNTKLKDFFLPYDQKDEIVNYLLDERFLDEKRFVLAFVKGRFHYKYWGKTKIRYHLKGKQIADSFIEEAMKAISDEEYWSTLMLLAERKMNSLEREEDPYKKKNKLIAHLQSKGYEMELIYKVADQLL